MEKTCFVVRLSDSYLRKTCFVGFSFARLVLTKSVVGVLAIKVKWADVHKR